ncbi:MAG: hypothetical protein M3P49_16790 [Actinomycetota bacterium]|nr:hypothetical protein [Actinomycetota bacterium]
MEVTIAAKRPGRTRSRTVRLSMDVPKDLHKELRMRALTEDATMTDYVIDLIERALRDGRKGGSRTT